MPNHPPTDGAWRHQIPSPSFPPAPDRYHLYVGLFCPFAHRVLIARELKGFQSILPISVVAPYPKEPHGWRFPATDDEYPSATIDHLYHSNYLHEIYFKCDSDYRGKYSVPVLWDKETEQIINNESEDIMQMLCHAFDEFLPPSDPKRELNFYPINSRIRIDEISAWLGPNLNSGVYKAGFASTQADYEYAALIVFDTLDQLEAILARTKPHSPTPFLLQTPHPTTLDIKLFTTIIRFDVIYAQHFKLMLKSIRHNYPNLHHWMKNMYHNIPGIASTVDFKHIKENYSKSHPDINPKAITPLGPSLPIEPWTEEDEKRSPQRLW